MATQLQEQRAIAPVGTWTIDPSHSIVGFKVRHLMISNVTGRFGDFEGALEVGDETKAELVVRTASIDTSAEQRDGHLRSPDFFDAETYPELRFVSTSVEADGDAWRIAGELTIKDVTRPVELEASVEGSGTDPWGNERVALELRGEIERSAFGLTWNQALETGGVAVGDRVKLALDFELVKVKAA